MSLTSVRSDCAVSGFVIRTVLCSAIPYRNQRVERLMFRRQHKEKLGWNNTSVQPIRRAPLPGVDMKALADNLYPVLTTTMYSLWRCVLKVWAQLRPSTGFTRCEITTKHQACSSRTPPRDINLQWCLAEDIACPHSSSYPPSKSSSCLADRRFSQPHYCFPQWLASAFLTSSLRPATAREP